MRRCWNSSVRIGALQQLAFRSRDYVAGALSNLQGLCSRSGKRDQTMTANFNIFKKPPIGRRRNVFSALRRFVGPMLTAYPRQLLQITLHRFAWCAMRYAWFVFLLRRQRVIERAEGVANNTVSHNLRGMFDLHVERSLRLVLPLCQLEWIRNHITERTILTIGPRTEGEIYNLIGQGFRRKNITALDLISYSPMITLGDMHAMPYEAGRFDCVLLGWVISYSDEKQRAAAEVLRVVKRGGLIAVGVEWARLSASDVAQNQGYTVGSQQRLLSTMDILQLFEPHVHRVYFEQDDQDISSDSTGDLLLVFRVK